MAVTGFMMISFVTVHFIGNSTIFFSWLNNYAEHLHALPPLVWAFRLVMFTAFCLHVYFGITLYLENRAAKPNTYTVNKTLCTSFAARTMIWTGLIIAAFLIYHLLHFTFQITHPSIAAKLNADSMGRPDVYKMVVLSFQQFSIAFIYACAMIAVALHVSHGIQSFLQTIGLNTERTLPVFVKAGVVMAIILFAGYVAIPAAALTRILKG
jgi:succinate dehydrogenase / fumarate reductase cytochrome b subunit